MLASVEVFHSVCQVLLSSGAPDFFTFGYCAWLWNWLLLFHNSFRQSKNPYGGNTVFYHWLWIGFCSLCCRYYEGGVSSVYLWDLDHGFAGVILIKKGWHLSYSVCIFTKIINKMNGFEFFTWGLNTINRWKLEQLGVFFIVGIPLCNKFLGIAFQINLSFSSITDNRHIHAGGSPDRYHTQFIVLIILHFNLHTICNMRCNHTLC